MSGLATLRKAPGSRPQALAAAAGIADARPDLGLRPSRGGPRRRLILLVGPLLSRVHLSDIKWPSARSFFVQLLFTWGEYQWAW